jgi:aspartyl-tRNA(Asn)/glutamyl-tRNA(Gln) amidotransferase subunit A
VSDAALVLTAMAGFDPLDAMSISVNAVNYADAVRERVSGLRIGIPRAPFFENLDPEIATAVDQAITLLSTMTRSMTDVVLPIFDSFAAAIAEAHAYHVQYVADPERRKLYQPSTRQKIVDGSKVPVPIYIDTRRRMSVARNTIADVFSKVDVIVTPTTIVGPPTIADALAQPKSELVLIRNTSPFNVLGIPTISVPCGFTRTGLPIGLQISGPRLGEAAMLALANGYEQATDWHRREPALP